jgi:anti-sigma B factor antagonist
MKINTSQINGYIKVHIDLERLDVVSMKEVKDEINQILQNENKIILDMSTVTFLDSSGLSVLIGILKTLNKTEDSELKLCSLTTQPAELMEVTQLYNVFDIIEDCSKL